MLPTNRRIKKDLFDEIIKKGVFVSGDNLYLKFLNRLDAAPTLLSFVVPAKIKKTSVGRHLIKRRISAVVENMLANIEKGLSVIVFAKKDVSLFTFQKLNEELVGLFKKAKILKK